MAKDVLFIQLPVPNLKEIEPHVRNCLDSVQESKAITKQLHVIMMQMQQQIHFVNKKLVQWQLQ